MTGPVTEILRIGSLHHGIKKVQRGDLQDRHRTALRRYSALCEGEGLGGTRGDFLKEYVLCPIGAQWREEIDVAEQ